MFLACCVDDSQSRPEILMPIELWRTTLLLNTMSRTTVQGAVWFWFFGVNRMAYPFWNPHQLFSNRLPSMVTRWAFFSSRWFL